MGSIFIAIASGSIGVLFGFILCAVLSTNGEDDEYRN